MQCLHGLVAILSVQHFDIAKTFRLAGEVVVNDPGCDHRAMGGKKGPQVRIGHGVDQVTDIKIHAALLSSDQQKNFSSTVTNDVLNEQRGWETCKSMLLLQVELRYTYCLLDRLCYCKQNIQSG